MWIFAWCPCEPRPAPHRTLAGWTQGSAAEASSFLTISRVNIKHPRRTRAHPLYLLYLLYLLFTNIYHIYCTVTGRGRKQNCIMIIVAWATLDPCKHVNKEVDVDIQFLQYGSWKEGTQVHVILLLALAMWHNGRTKQNSGQGGVKYIKCFRCWQVSSRWCFQNS